MSTNRDQFEILSDEVVMLHMRWNIIEDLFTQEVTVDILDASAPDAFQTIFAGFLDLVVMGITRLVSDRDNRALTLEDLRAQYDGTQLGVELKEVLEETRSFAHALKIHRDKRIAHHDADVAGSPKQGQSHFELPQFTRSQIESALDGIRRFMNSISVSRDKSTTYYERVFSRGDGRSLVEVLRDGLRLRELRDAAWDGSWTANALVDELRKWPDQYPDAG